MKETNRLSQQYQFFHWHLTFPEVLSKGGFNCVLGNPPWEVLEDEEKKLFSEARPDIASAETAERKVLIEALQDTDVGLLSRWLAFRDERSRFKHFHRASSCFPLSSYKKLNLYATMMENGLRVLCPSGYLGMVLQSGLATDESRKFLFQELFDSKRLRSFLDFENIEGLFPGVHPQQKFSLVTVGMRPSSRPTKFSFYNTRIEHLREKDRSFEMTAVDMKRVSPNTGACPTFRNKHDAEVILHSYRIAPVFCDESKAARWRVDFSQMFNSSSDNRLFKKASEVSTFETVDGLYTFCRENKLLPIYEGKFLGRFNHRLATFEGRSRIEIANGSERELQDAELCNPYCFVVPRWWVPEELVLAKLTPLCGKRKWLFGFCDIANPQNARTACASFFPYSGVTDTVWLLDGDEPTEVVAGLCAAINAFVLDFIARRRIGSRHLKQFVFKQLPFPERERLKASCEWQPAVTMLNWLLPRVLELTYTAWDLEPFARDIGWSGPPFLWDKERRFLIRCELDAAFFSLYLRPR